MKDQKGNTLIGIFIGIIIVLILGAAYYFGVQLLGVNYFSGTIPPGSIKNTNEVTVTTKPTSLASPAQADSTSDWKTFTAQFYTIKYPPNWAESKTNGEGCGPVLKPTDNSLNGWVSLCPADANNTTPTDEANALIKITNQTKSGTIVNQKSFNADGSEGQEVELQQDLNNWEIDAFAGKVYQSVNLPNGQTEQRYGPVGIYLYQKDALHKDEARKVFDQMLLTVHFTK